MVFPPVLSDLLISAFYNETISFTYLLYEPSDSEMTGHRPVFYEMFSVSSQIPAGNAFFGLPDLLRSSAGHDTSALFTAARSHVDNIVRVGDYV